MQVDNTGVDADMARPLLSILYLRCKWRMETEELNMPEVLSILYLRCRTAAEQHAGGGFSATFNSLFEML